MKGISGLMPQDDPDVKVLNARTDLDDLQKKELEIYAQIGKQAISQQGPAAFGELSERLRLVQSDIQAAEQKIKEAEQAKEQQEQAKKQAMAQRTCPNCGTENPEGVNFCQQCGTKLGGTAKLLCPQCGAENAPDTKFCGNCGSKIGA